MKFSIITITYNAERFLNQTLLSVAQQEGVEFEHIIWDGGSSDNTLDIAKRFEHVKIIEGKDEGIADAMNRGAEHAQGDFLLHLHADDFLVHSTVLLMVQRALRLHPHIEWLYGQADIVDETGGYLRTTPFEPFSIKRLRRYNFITHPATFVSRELFNKVGGFHAQLKYCMDYDLWLRLGQVATPFVLPTTLATFREHQNSLSTKEPLHVADEAYRVRNRYVNTFFERLRSYRTWKKRRKKITDERMSATVKKVGFAPTREAPF